MPESAAPGSSATPIAIVGLACRFPDADDPLALFESAMAGRRAFRRLSPGRLGAVAGPDAGHRAGLAGMASGAAPRAAVLEGWQFDRVGFAVPEHTYLATDPAHWLALETAGRALADAGFPGGQGLARDRAGVIIGNTLTGEVSRAAALRTRWPFVRAVLTTALAPGDVPPAERARALRQATTAFAAVPEVSGETLAGSQSGAIADRICRQFGFRGGRPGGGHRPFLVPAGRGQRGRPAHRGRAGLRPGWRRGHQPGPLRARRPGPGRRTCRRRDADL